ncbi:MAG: hypothetical protein FWC21_05380 [Treponema sp.]|nr:hypothetical protein [Treponema sp.]
MILNELIQRSPIRIFEQSINGGLKNGEIGVVASPNGVGKTSVLVQLAMDKLLQGKKVIHVSFTHAALAAQNKQYVPLWYEDIFTEFTSKKNLENAAEIKNDLVKNRVLMSFNQDGVTKEQILKSLRAMIINGGFKADSIIIDGMDFSRFNKEGIADVKSFAVELGLSIWYSCSLSDNHPQYNKENIPVILENLTDSIDIIIALHPKPDYVELSVSKDRGAYISKQMAMKLDPRTLLILEA